jgi:hypothetical protein
MLRVRPLVLRSLLLLASLLALPAVAQTPCSGVCIGFAAAGGVAGVPISPGAMLLLSLLVAGAGYVAMRRRSGLMAFVVATALTGAALSADIRDAIAASLYQVVLGAGSMASVSVPTSYVGPVDVQNSNAVPATVTSLTLAPGFALAAATTLHVGDVIPGGTTLMGPVTVDGYPVAGGAFAALADMTISDQIGVVPIVPINAGGVTDPAGRGIVYSATGLPGMLAIDPATGVISGIYDSFVGTIMTESFNVTVTAHPTGSNLSISKTFVLTVRDDG